MAKQFEPGEEIISKTERSNKTYVVIDCTGNMVAFHDVDDRHSTYWRNVNTMELKRESVR